MQSQTNYKQQPTKSKYQMDMRQLTGARPSFVSGLSLVLPLLLLRLTAASGPLFARAAARRVR
jgi:hypothetical protein